MSENLAERDDDESPRHRAPLGLPPGSIRALLTFLVLAVVIVEMVRGHGNLLTGWNETLLIALAHYFTSRRMVRVPRALRTQLESQGHLPAEQSPLYLPRRSIRTGIVLALAGLTYYVVAIQKKQHFGDIPPTIVAAWAYLLGVFVRGVRTMLNPDGEHRSGAFGDVKAVLVLLLMLGTAIPYFLDRGSLVPQTLTNATLAFVLFYFGSR